MGTNHELSGITHCTISQAKQYRSHLACVAFSHEVKKKQNKNNTNKKKKKPRTTAYTANSCQLKFQDHGQRRRTQP